jgi:hypothetical protein
MSHLQAVLLINRAKRGEKVHAAPLAVAHATLKNRRAEHGSVGLGSLPELPETERLTINAHLLYNLWRAQLELRAIAAHARMQQQRQQRKDAPEVEGWNGLLAA